MGCSTCAVSKDGTPTGCGDKGHCSSGSCNKMNTFDWLTTLELNDPSDYHIVEVSFKKGTRKAFFMNSPSTRAMTGDMVIVEAATGYDVGRISLSGDLVRAQMKKKRTNEERVIHSVIRKANDRDLSKLADARAKEKPAMIKARQLARTLGLEMKIGEVEYQGDIRKATFYYIADGRVDFRELVRVYAKEFRVKIEMKQIGSRQESGLVGGVGACGRELCCSTWLSDFSTVTTAAARYQNIAINQTKLSGQCGRLKCCLNYELDMYIDALSEYPRKIDKLRTQQGMAYLMKVDIFSQLMFYTISTEYGRNIVVGLTKEQVIEYKKMNDNGEKPEKLIGADALIAAEATDKVVTFEGAGGEMEMPETKKKSKNNRRKGNSKKGGPKKGGPKKGGGNNSGPKNSGAKNSGPKSGGQKKGGSKGEAKGGQAKQGEGKKNVDRKDNNKPNNKSGNSKPPKNKNSRNNKNKNNNKKDK